MNSAKGGQAGKVLIRRSVPATQIFFFHLSSETISHYFSINIKDQHYTGLDCCSVVEIDFKKNQTRCPLACLRTLSQMHDVFRIATTLLAERSGIEITDAKKKNPITGLDRA